MDLARDAVALPEDGRLARLLAEPGHLHGERGLVGERFGEVDLALQFGRIALAAAHADPSHGLLAQQHRDRQQRAHAQRVDVGAVLLRHAGDLDAEGVGLRAAGGEGGDTAAAHRQGSQHRGMMRLARLE